MGGDSGGGRGGNPNKRRGSWSDSDDNNNNNNNSRTAGSSSSSSSSSWSSSTDDNNKRSRRSFYDKQEYEQHQHQQSRDYYEILDVPRNATLDDIKKAYRRLAIKYHPDKNKEHDACDKFREITQAYEVLSNQEKRDTYDRFGQAGLQGGGGMHFTNAEDLFSQFFTSSGLYQEVFGSHYGRSDRCGASSSASSSSDKKKKGEDVVHTLRVTLEDMYKGITKRLRITRMIKCSECIGQGTKVAAEKKSCPKCRGSGTTQTSEMMRHHQVGGQGQGQGYAQQQQQQFQSTTTTTSTCTMCNGEGRVSIERSSKDDHHHHHYHRCVACQGKSMIEEKKEIDVPIRPGIRDGERIIFERQANDLPDCDAVPGDIIIVVRQKPHSTFTRMPGHQHHLLMQRKIKLVEALCGLEFTFNHLDGRSIWVSYKRGELIYDGDIKKITGEGMCYSENSAKRGDLYIKFDIEFPLQGSLSEKNREALEANLPPREPMPADRTGYHFVNLEDANISAELMKEQFEDDDIAEQGEDDRIHTRDYYGGGDDVGDGRDDRRSGTCSQQ